MVDANGLLRISYVVLNCCIVTHESKVIRATNPIDATFFFEDQFMGFAGSSGPSQSTVLGSFGVFSSVGTAVALFSPADWRSRSVSSSCSEGLEWTKPLSPESAE
jgi:hypothetical protein